MPLGSASSSKRMKQRAACNRCHELKSRCTQSSSTGGKCDRCERLGIRCVYSAKLPLGRPKAASTRRNDAGDRHSDRHRTVDSRSATAENAPTPHDARSQEVRMSPLYDDYFASITPRLQLDYEFEIGSPGLSLLKRHDFQPSHEFAAMRQTHNRADSLGEGNDMYLADAPSTSNFGSVIDLSSPQFDGEPFDIVESLSGAKDLLGHPYVENQRVSTADITNQDAMSTSSTCESLDRGFNGTQNEPSTLKRLLDLQLQLQSLSASQASTSYEPRGENSGCCGLGEVLFAAGSLTKILSDVVTRRSRSNSHPPRTAANAGHSSRGLGEFSLSPLDEEGGLINLNALSCYLYLLRMFELMVTSLRKQYRDSVGKSSDVSPHRGNRTPALSLGSFSLASEPELNIQVTLNLIHLVVQRLHRSVQSLTLEESHRASGAGTVTSDGDEEQGTQGPSSMVHAALVAIESVHLMEASVLRKLENPGREEAMDDGSASNSPSL